MRRWTADLGVAAPVLVNGVLYTMTAPPQAPIPTTLSVNAVRARDGTRLWGVPLPTGAGVGPLAVSGTRVVVPTLQHGTGILTALAAADGHVVWRTAPLPMVQPKTDSAGPFIQLLASFISPLAFGGGYVLALTSSTEQSSSTFAFAWNLSDGSLAWQVALAGASAYAGRAGTIAVTGTTATISYADVALGSGAVLGLDLATGAQRWPQVRAGGIYATSAAVVVIAGTGYEAITGVRASDGTTLWQWQPPLFGHFAFDAVAISDTTLVFRTFDYDAPNSNLLSPRSVMPHLYAVSRAAGTLLWDRALATTAPYSATFSFVGNGAVYYQYYPRYGVVQSKQAHWTLLALDERTGVLQWQNTTDGWFEQPVAQSGAILATTVDPRYCGPVLTALDAHSGALAWYLPLPCEEVDRYFSGWLVVG
jgi:outer membrane protein assembly factor BamB